MITITAQEKHTQQHFEWLRPRGLDGGILQDRANRHIVCTRATNMIATSKKNTYRDALLHTTRFLSVTYPLAWWVGVPKTGNNFSTQDTRGKIIFLMLLNCATRRS